MTYNNNNNIERSAIKLSEQLIYVNGQFVTKDQATISVYDHGFLYGDGVFEGIRVYEGNVYKLKEHIDRLYESAHSIMLQIPHTKEEMQEIICETVRKNELKSAYIRVVVSRGKGDLGLDPRNCAEPTVIVIAEPLAIYSQELYEKGLKVASVTYRRSSPDVLNPQIKSLNYLNNVLVKIASTQAGADEALILNNEGYVTEGSADNIFIVKNGIIYTPPVYLGALDGITRQVIIAIAKELDMPLIEKPFTLHDVYNADEVFLTGTAAEVIPVISVDERQIGDGKPGKITNILLKHFRKQTLTDGVQCYE